jgi:kumamolisin
MFKTHISPDAVHLCKTDDNEMITAKLLLRRHVGHDPIPHHSEFVGCPKRERLSNDEFAAKFGASQEDTNIVIAYHQSLGLSVLSTHLARREIVLHGTCAQFNSAFNIELNDYEKQIGKNTIKFHSYSQSINYPPHITDLILLLSGLDNEPKNFRNPNPGEPSVVSILTVAQTAAFYNSPSHLATGQTIAIGLFPGSGTWLSSDITLTCNKYSVTVPTITTVVIDSITLGSETEATLDISMAACFGAGANIAVYEANFPYEIVSRIANPNTGDPVCNIVSFSIAYNETNFASSAIDTIMEDGALQGITILAASGDWGTTTGTSNIDVCWPASNPYVTAVGGTVIGANSGTVSTSNYVEWFWNTQTYYNVGGGGVSVEYAQPAYQAAITMPANLSTLTGRISGSPGRGVPDIAGLADPAACPQFYYGGFITNGGGTSSASPMMAGIFARINAAVGRNIGFINPTLYYLGTNTSYLRRPNSGGATSSAFTNTHVSPSVNVPGYPVSLTAYDCCVGLGMLNAGNLVTYLTTNTSTSYWIKIQATNSFGPGTMSPAYGPFTVNN